jgi:hypothetical protein
MKKGWVVAVAWAAVMQVEADWAPVYGVELSPEVPTEHDAVSIRAYGEVGSSSWYIQLADTVISGRDIMMEIYFQDSGVGVPAITPWMHTEDVGNLAVGTYSLTVKTYQNSSLADSYASSFSVVPEPSTMGLTALGGAVLYARRRRTVIRRFCARPAGRLRQDRS